MAIAAKLIKSTIPVPKRKRPNAELSSFSMTYRFDTYRKLLYGFAEKTK
jgi:hypothetical protein